MKNIIALTLFVISLINVPIADTHGYSSDDTSSKHIIPTEQIEETVSIETTREENTYESSGSSQVSKSTETTISIYELEIEEPLPEQMDECGYLSVASWREIEMLAYLVDGEIGGGTYNEKCAVVWCVLNRMDSNLYDFRNLHTITDVLTQRFWSSSAQKWVYQFRSYYGIGSRQSTDVVIDCLTLYMMEKQSGYPITGRTLPIDYCWYYGDGRHNHFRNAYQGGTEWDWHWTNGY